MNDDFGAVFGHQLALTGDGFDYADLEVDEDDPFTEEHEYDTGKIMACHPAPGVPGGWEFKTRWEGCERTHVSWESASAFVPRYTQCFVDVCVPK